MAMRRTPQAIRVINRIYITRRYSLRQQCIHLAHVHVGLVLAHMLVANRDPSTVVPAKGLQCQCLTR